MRQELPPLFQRAVHSDYRERIAGMGQPIDTQTRTRAEFASFLNQSISIVHPDDIMIDLTRIDAVLEGLVRRIGQMAAAGDPIALECLERLRTRSLNENPDEVGSLIEIFRRHGFFILPKSEGIICGPVLSEHRFGDREFLVTASLSNPDNHNQTSMDNFSVVDVVTILEEAVYKLNFVKYHELEPVASHLFREDEYGYQPAYAKKTLKRRLKMAKEVNRRDIYRLIKELEDSNTTDERTRILVAGMRVSLVHFTWLDINRHSSDDEIQHTLKLLNDLVRVPMMVDGFASAVGRCRVSELDPLITALANFVPIIFGDYPSKISDFYGSALKGTGSETAGIIYGTLLPRLIKYMGFRPGGPSHEQSYFLISRREDEIRSAARAMVDDVLQEQFGLRLGTVCDPVEFERIARTRIITREQLPLIAGVWRERYGIVG